MLVLAAAAPLKRGGQQHAALGYASGPISWSPIDLKSDEMKDEYLLGNILANVFNFSPMINDAKTN